MTWKKRSPTAMLNKGLGQASRGEPKPEFFMAKIDDLTEEGPRRLTKLVEGETVSHQNETRFSSQPWTD